MKHPSANRGAPQDDARNNRAMPPRYSVMRESRFARRAGAVIVVSLVITACLGLLLRTNVRAVSAAFVETPRSADAFVDSIGVNTHFEYTHTPYYVSKDQELKELLALGVRHIRDGLPNPKGEALQTLNALCSQGIHHTVDFNTDVVPSTIVSTLTAYGPTCVDAVEPENEYDSVARGKQNPDPDWVQHLLQEQRVLYSTVKSNPAFGTVTVLGPALASSASMRLLGNLDSISDAGNMHFSTCDGSPTTSHYKNVDRSLAYYSENYVQKPIWTTEASYSDDVGKSICNIPDSVAANYILRTQAERYLRGQPRTYWYEFSDVPSEGIFSKEGFVDSSGQPKLQYTALQNLIRVLNDPGPAFQPAALAYELRGETDKLHHLLLQKRDGTYYLLLWVDVESWDAVSHGPKAAAPSQTVTLQLPPGTQSVKAYTYSSDWRLSTRTVAVTGSHVAVGVADRISIVSFKTR